MRQNSVGRAVNRPRNSSCASIALFASLIFFGTPSVLGYQDMASLISGSEGASGRTQSIIRPSAAGSIQQADMPYDSDMTTGSIDGGGIEAPGIGKIAFSSKSGQSDATPDEDRVNRSEKMGRLVGVSKVTPPKAFTAGSVLKRTSSLLRPTLSTDVQMAFEKNIIRGKEIQLALNFHEKTVKAAPVAQLPSLIADLANDKMIRIAASAYAPAEPDYATESPFESLLKQDTSKLAAVIPFAPGDHDWAKNPLPASVYSTAEQRCLAAGVYFEARGESTKGQAAVAQVILNRVKNPTYPNTICGVVYQNDDWKNRCQFSFACDGIKDKIGDSFHWKKAEEVALAVTSGEIYLPEVGGSTHYHAVYVKPGWARTMEKMKKIGSHIFYRTYGGGWS